MRTGNLHVAGEKFVPPSLSILEKNALTNIEVGTVIYSEYEGVLEYWDGSAWKILVNALTAGTDSGIFVSNPLPGYWDIQNTLDTYLVAGEKLFNGPLNGSMFSWEITLKYTVPFNKLYQLDGIIASMPAQYGNALALILVSNQGEVVINNLSVRFDSTHLTAASTGNSIVVCIEHSAVDQPPIPDMTVFSSRLDGQFNSGNSLTGSYNAYYSHSSGAPYMSANHWCLTKTALTAGAYSLKVNV